MAADADPDHAGLERRILKAFENGASLPDPAEHKVPGSKRDPVRNVTVLPFTAIGLVVCKGANTLYGTAVYCAPDAVVTAKHTFSVPGITGAWLYPAFDAKQNPSKAVRVVAAELHPTLDLAVLIVEGSPQQPLPFPGASTADGQHVYVVGYGSPYNDGSMQMSSGAGAVDNPSAQRFGYAITTGDGDSGAPVLAGTPQSGYTVVGIHTSGNVGLPSGSNFGIPMTPAHVNVLTQMLQSARQKMPR